MRSRISRHLQSILRTRDGAKSARAAAIAELPGALPPPISPELTGHQYAIFLLRVAAGIEHALMAQYLYAAYSLGGPGVGAGDRELVTRWQEVILGIAKEEMGHLITVQNVLRLISGPISFDREDYPYDAAFYPFDFTLERLSLGSLAKYVYAEKPPDWSGPLANEITRLARKANHDAPLNAVSELYGLMIETIADRSLVPDGAFRAETRPEQASWNEWGRGYAHGARGNAHEGGPVGTPDVIIDTMATRGEAVAALSAIAEQGEATRLVDGERSHFERFRAIYVQWKDRERKGAFNPVRPVAANPVVEDSLGGPPPVSGSCTVITQPVAFYWGHLFNVRYRLLLSALTHVFESTEVSAPDAQPSARSELITLIFGEMYKVRGLASVLVELPAHDGVPSTQLAAGPPFEMPYTLTIPRREVDRWRWHNDMLAASRTILVELQRIDHDPRRAAFARAISDGDAELMRRIELIISGLASPRSDPMGGRI